MWSIGKTISLAALLRFALISFAAVQDYLAEVRYTDIDYQVYTDAAESLYLGMSPYYGRTAILRHELTKYRYPPLIAWMLIPNVTYFHEWGKVLFVLCDLLCGYLIYLLIVKIYVAVKSSAASEDASKNRSSSQSPEHLCYSDGESISVPSRSDVVSPSKDWALLDKDGADAVTTKEIAMQVCCNEMASFCTAVFLFNPFVFSLSTRGSCDSFITLILLLFIYFLMKAHRDSPRKFNLLISASIYGLAVHIRIYPVIFIIPLFFTLSFRDYVVFGMAAFATFLTCNGMCYSMYGAEYVREALLYHINARVDSQHNFSIWFYPFWICQNMLAKETVAGAIRVVKAFAFLLQWPLVFAAGCIPVLRYRGCRKKGAEFILARWIPAKITFPVKTADRHGIFYVPMGWTGALPFVKSMTIQITLFVALNRVITAQYFLWFWQFLPLWLPSMFSSSSSIAPLGNACIYWTVAELHWLLWGYILEFQKQEWARPCVWGGSAIFLLANFNLCKHLWQTRIVYVKIGSGEEEKKDR